MSDESVKLEVPSRITYEATVSVSEPLVTATWEELMEKVERGDELHQYPFLLIYKWGGEVDFEFHYCNSEEELDAVRASLDVGAEVDVYVAHEPKAVKSKTQRKSERERKKKRRKK